MTTPGRHPNPSNWHVGWCEWCGKERFADKRTAKAAGRARRRWRTERVSVYRCPDWPDYWHLGRLLPATKDGDRARGVIREGAYQLHLRLDKDAQGE